MADITGWKQDLGASGQDLRVFLITVDPERDTMETLSAYVSWTEGIQGGDWNAPAGAKRDPRLRDRCRQDPA